MIDGTLSLRTRLLRRLLVPLLLLLFGDACFHHWRASAKAREEQDHALQRVAIALASRLDVDADDLLDADLGAHLDRTMEAIQRATSRDKLIFLVRGPEERLLGGDARLNAATYPAGVRAPVFEDRSLDDEPLRAITYPHDSTIGRISVVVAETTHRRDSQARKGLVETVASNVVLMFLTLLLVRTGVDSAMRPLASLGRSVASRSPDDLSPLPVSRLPGELVPLVRAIDRLMANLKAAAMQQQDFVSAAAHQLRTPLAGIQTQLELTARGADDTQKLRLEQVQGALRRVTHTTHQMLALARSGPQATQATQFERLDLRQLLEDAASDWLDVAVAARVDLGFDAQPAWVQGSPWMLRELLGNLIDNALKHSTAGGCVTVRSGTEASGTMAFLIVDDQGPGMPQPLLAKAFDRFFRAPGPTGSGSGLGLAIVQQVAVHHGGTATLQPGPGGIGLRAHVRLPAVEPAPQVELVSH